ncbi:hypothetical protein [Arsenophonus sp.]|uniref:hypothetical protein n=1 Tax=Arsenophonus sp. TaxID=1872640 RepID=UPI00285ECF75|nr:hypothetical protein [Arsenophonus sp.]MDR5616825.1 hypothetical protein [Arsenophonus sp.]MDR5618311.1 hypothetical protein [Arsenophonus sp.]
MSNVINLWEHIKTKNLLIINKKRSINRMMELGERIAEITEEMKVRKEKILREKMNIKLIK